MEEVKALTSKVQDLLKEIETVSKERDKYEKQCFHVIDELNKKTKMLNEIQKIVFK